MRLDAPLQPSRHARVLVWAAGGASLACIALVPLALPLRLATGALLLACTLRADQRTASGAWARLQLSTSLHLTLHAVDGTVHVGRVTPASVVSPWMVSLVYREDGAAGWHPARAVWLLPDAMSADDWRRLCVLLRWAAPDGPPPDSGTDDKRKD